MSAAVCTKRLTAASTRKGIRGLATPVSNSFDFTVSEANGYKIASSDDQQSPTSAITVALKAGPRYESAPGLAHILKNFVFRVG